MLIETEFHLHHVNSMTRNQAIRVTSRQYYFEELKII